MHQKLNGIPTLASTHKKVHHDFNLISKNTFSKKSMLGEKIKMIIVQSFVCTAIKFWHFLYILSFSYFLLFLFLTLFMWIVWCLVHSAIYKHIWLWATNPFKCLCWFFEAVHNNVSHEDYMTQNRTFCGAKRSKMKIMTRAQIRERISPSCTKY